MSQPELKTRRQLVTDAIRRLLTYTDQISWFGPNSVGRALAETVGGQTSTGNRLYRALIRRFTLLASSGDFTTQVAEERGARRLGPQRSKVLVVVQPRAALVTAITLGATDLIEVDDSTDFVATASIRIRSADGTDTETATIIAVTTGTGPNGGDELEVASLANSYSPLSEDVRVLLRTTIPAESVISTTAGINLQTLDALSVGDANPVLDGEGTVLALADKVFAEAVTPGEAGNIDPETVVDFVPPITGIQSVFNPEAGRGGADEETDFDLKYRASHGPARAGQETLAWLEQIGRDGNSNVLRVVRTPTTTISTMSVKVLHRNGGALSATAKVALKAYVEARTRSQLLVELLDITLTSVEVEAQITLDQDADLRTVWKEAANRLAAFIDFRKWPFGENVDEAALLSLVRQTPGVASLVTGTFAPAADVEVGEESLPHLTRLTIENTATGEILAADLSMSF